MNYTHTLLIFALIGVLIYLYIKYFNIEYFKQCKSCYDYEYMNKNPYKPYMGDKPIGIFENFISYIIPKISNTLEDNQENSLKSLNSLNSLNTLKHTYFGDGIPLFTEDRISLPDNYISKNRDKQIWENIKDKRCCRSTYSTTGSCVCDFKEKNYSTPRTFQSYF